MSDELSASQENYLEAIFALCQQDGHAHVTDIASRLSLSKPSVHRAMSQLRASGMVMQKPYGFITLTDEGLTLAKDVVKRHSVFKRFFNEILGLDEETADTEACLVEHAISRDTANRLSDYLDTITSEKP